jgi:hypothetical protein
MRWQPGDIAFDIVAEDTDHPIATVAFETPAGEIKFIAELSEDGRQMRSASPTCACWRTS